MHPGCQECSLICFLIVVMVCSQWVKQQADLVTLPEWDCLKVNGVGLVLLKYLTFNLQD